MSLTPESPADVQKERYRAQVADFLSRTIAFGEDGSLKADPAYLKAVEDFYMSLPFIDYSQPIREDNLLVAAVIPILLTLQYKKEGAYLRSWCKRGELDIFFNTARKFDRLENLMLHKGKDEVGESKVDTIADLASYSLLWLTYTLREQTADFSNWMENNL